jgi:cytosine/adenosine deaminase-related metal-dependent hydrolase
VGLGTDSEASVGALDLFAEAREARRIGRLNAEETLSLMTLDGAIAIGVQDVGCLAEGAWGDVGVVGTGAEGRNGGEVIDPVEFVLSASPARVMATYLAGRRVH